MVEDTAIITAYLSGAKTILNMMESPELEEIALGVITFIGCVILYVQYVGEQEKDRETNIDGGEGVLYHIPVYHDDHPKR